MSREEEDREIIPRAGFEVEGDLFLVATGQRVDIPREGEVELTSHYGTIMVDDAYASRGGVFAGGDVVLSYF